MGRNSIFFKITVRQMIKNKIRTMVTIIGIIFSAALITAVSVFISSLHKSMLEFKIKETGSWHGVVQQLDSEDIIDEINSDKEVKETAVLFKLDSFEIYGKTEDRDKEDKYNVNLTAFKDSWNENLPLKLSEGRMPENSYEIAVDKKLIKNEIFQECKIGDILELGSSNGKTYKVVGIFEEAGFESLVFNGYSVFTKYDENADKPENADVYVTMRNSDDIYTFLGKYGYMGYEVRYNNSVLRLMGTMPSSGVFSFVITIAAIVIFIVMGASVLMIYNSFAISVNERMKKFGLLSSVGATKAQLRNCVLQEALIVGAVGIPAGIIAGITGIGITLVCIRTSLKNIAASVVSLGEMKLYVSFAAVIMAAAVSMITVLISTFVPLHHISKMSAIEVIRQNADVKLNRRRVYCSRLFVRLFGVEGMVSRKNFKRSHKKYRTTILSLFVSVVMFISASTLMIELIEMAEQNYKLGEYDIYYMNTDEENDIIAQLKNVSEVTQASETLTTGMWWYDPDSNKGVFTKEYKEKFLQDTGGQQSDFCEAFFVFGIEDSLYADYLKQNNLQPEVYMNSDNPVFLIYSNRRTADENTGKKHDFSAFQNTGFELNAYYGYYEKNSMIFKVGSCVKKLPYSIKTERRYNYDMLLCSYSMLENIVNENQYLQDDTYSEIYFKTTDHTKAYEDIVNILKENNMYYRYKLTDEVLEYESGRSMVFVIKVFSYGFFVLMSLIATANVFNTISTNMMLRRREFAMLRSVGMTKEGFNKMLYYECFMYGSKSLLFGIPVSVLVSAWISKAVNQMQVMAFNIPWKAMIISVLCVYLIVLITMIYSKEKLNKLNLIECIKEENI